MKIRSIDRDISDILKSGFYRIPRFQRAYSWDRDNIDDFWNDVVVNSEGDYFIGSMVVYKAANSDISFVVDGQQRLTTITMILATLRNAFRAEGFADLADGIQLLIERKDISNQSQFSLQTETSYPYFHTQIQLSAASSSEHEVVSDEEYSLRMTFTYLTASIKSTIDAIKQDKSSSEKIRETR